MTAKCVRVFDVRYMPAVRATAIVDEPVAGLHLRGGDLQNRLCASSPFAASAARGQERTVDKIGWLHIPKTGTTFMNVVMHWACRGLPSTLNAVDMIRLEEETGTGSPLFTNAWAQ